MRPPQGGAIFNQAIQLPAAINLTLRPVTMNPLEVNLDITPNSRFQLIDVSARIREEAGDCLEEFRKVLYCSFHTTAGYLEQGASARLGNSRKQLDPFFRMVQRIVFRHGPGVIVAVANILGQPNLERPTPVPSPLANMYAEAD